MSINKPPHKTENNWFGRYINNIIAKEGLPNAVDYLLKKGRCKVTTQYADQNIKEQLNTNNQGILIVAAHPYSYEPYPILASLPNHRKSEIHLLANQGFVSISKEFTKSLIPISNIFPPDQGKRRIFFSCFGFKEFTGDYKKQYQQNKESLALASSLVNDGEIVIILAEGVYKDWQSGLGCLIKELNEKALITMAYVQASLLTKRLLIELNVKYSSSFNKNTVLQGAFDDHRRQIVTYLKKLYTETFLNNFDK